MRFAIAAFLSTLFAPTAFAVESYQRHQISVVSATYQGGLAVRHGDGLLVRNLTDRVWALYTSLTPNEPLHIEPGQRVWLSRCRGMDHNGYLASGVDALSGINVACGQRVEIISRLEYQP